MKKVIIKSIDLCKSYSSNGEMHHVIKNVSLDIYEKDFTVIMGSSGAGKSTLLYCLSGMDSLSSGSVYYGEKQIDGLPQNKLAIYRRKSIGFVFQQIHLLENLTVIENISLPGLLLKNRSKKTIIEEAKVLLEKIGGTSFGSRLPSQISGGERQRVAVARSLINHPTILFADEPTGALNSSMGRDVLNLLTQVNNEGQSIVLVTHDIKAAIRANRVLYIKDGKIKAELNLENYSEEKEVEREKQMLSWLEDLGW